MLLSEWSASAEQSFLLSEFSTCIQHDGKEVYVIRHGQSEANIETDQKKKETDPRYLDSALTSLGVSQARSLQDIVHHWDIDLFLVSPLTRTMQTFANAFERYPNIDDIPITVAPVVTEFYLNYPECRGREKEELLKDDRLTSLKLFPRLSPSLATLPKGWWESLDDERRLSHFSQFIHHTKASRICVVAHWGFIHQLFSLNPGKQVIYSPDNCDWIQSVWKRMGDAYTRFPEEDRPALERYLLLLDQDAKNESKIPKSIISIPSSIQEHLNYSPSKAYAICLSPGGNNKRNGLLNEIIAFQQMFSETFTSAKDSSKQFYIPLSRFVSLPSQAEFLNFIHCLRKIRNLIVDKKHVWRVSSSQVGVHTRRSAVSGKLTNIFFSFDSLTLREECLKTLATDLNLGDSCVVSPFSASVVSVDDGNESQEKLVETIIPTFPCLYGAACSDVDYGWDYLFKKIKWRIMLLSKEEGSNVIKRESTVSFPLW